MLAIPVVFCCGVAAAKLPQKLNQQGFLTSPSGSTARNAAQRPRAHVNVIFYVFAFVFSRKVTK